MLMRISRSHSGQRVSLTFFHLASNGLISLKYSRRCRPRVGARELGQRARSRLGAGTQSLISIAGPRERVTRWRRSTRTSPPTGGSRQSGIMTSILSLVGPLKIKVPNTAKSAVPGNLSLSFQEHNMCKSQVNAFGVNIITSQCFRC